MSSYGCVRTGRCGTRRTERYHRLRALTYFAEAEAEPLPDMRIPFRWDEVKAFFTSVCSSKASRTEPTRRPSSAQGVPPAISVLLRVQMCTGIARTQGYRR